MAELRGQIDRVTYTDEESGFTIARVRIANEHTLVTCVGPMINPLPGEILDMRGEWTSHPRYGRQFKVESCRTTVPVTVQGIQKYLGSGLIKGIGPVMSKRIVEKFGRETLDVIENDIERLMEIPGIGEHRLDIIKKAWREQKAIRSVMIFLQGHGVSSTYAARIFKYYGNDSIKIVSENPYWLAMDIPGIGFLTADRIARRMGFDHESANRAEAGVLFALNGLADQGHTYYPEKNLIEEARVILEVEEPVLKKAVDSLNTRGRIVMEEAGRPDGRAVYLPPLYLAEVRTAERLKALIGTPRNKWDFDVDTALARARQSLSIDPAPRQVDAMRSSASSKVMIITGGPGTGKTTIIRAILAMHATGRYEILLGAPTGRAAKRLEESTGREAKTIHRLLEFSGRKGGFRRNRLRPLECDLLIIDEASMIDIMLMHHLLEALPQQSTLILVGDVNQLPSIGPGSVLKDSIRSGEIPVVELTEIFRQASESAIIMNAHRINRGEFPDIDTSRNGLSDFYFIEQDDPDKALELLLHLVCERIPSRFGFDPLDDVQVITPMNRGTLGVANLNNELQKALNTREDGITRGGRTFRINDKVIQIVNNYDKEVFNGDIGKIASADEEKQEVRVRFDDQTSVVYDFSELDELASAYAITVHKSQGSEYSAVVIPVTTQHYMMLQRDLLYTAVTRGKKLVVLIGTKKALAIAVKNDRTQRRYTLLQERLRQ
ncbi:MAG TPA: ATP-dependent RecD-like DNA helicase [Deltaproteobacteria bacterium]|nr:ATP-dependent RecD-like DNA helicase [Deltaproteobacteria bacterium]